MLIGILFLFGLICGVITGLVSVGGGIILIFSFVYLLPIFFDIRFSMETITGISIMQTVFSSMSGGIYYIRERLVQFKASIMTSIPALIGGAIGAVIASVSSEFFIEIIFAITALIAAIIMQIPYDIMKSNIVIIKKFHYILTSIVSFLIGVIGGLIGVGAGFLFIPIMIFIYKLDIKKAIGSSLIVVFCLSLGGFIAKISINAINIEYGIIVTLGGIVGAQVGGRIAKQINSLVLKRIATLAILLVSIKLIYDLLV